MSSQHTHSPQTSGAAHSLHSSGNSQTTAGSQAQDSPNVTKGVEGTVDTYLAKGSQVASQTSSATETFKEQIKATTDNAVAEGERDVDSAKASAASYIQQAKDMASSTIAVAQSYLPTNLGGQPPQTSPQAGEDGTGTSFRQAEETVSETGKDCLESAQRNARPYIDKVEGMVQGSAGTAGIQGGTPAITAPLESGTHGVDTMYPPKDQDKVKATQLAEVEH